jgi:CRP-like cAMP-binding protein
LRSSRTRTIKLSESDKIKALKECPSFKLLSPNAIRALASQATPVHYPKGSYIFNDGDPAECFYLAQDGLIKLYKASRSGKNVTFKIASLGDTLNASALSIKRYFLSAEAMTDATVLRIPGREFWAVVSRHPGIAVDIIGQLSRGLDAEYNRIVNIIGEEVEFRVAQSLYTLASKFGPNLQLKREDLANYAGTTTETAIRVLSRFRKKGIITSAGRGAIAICNLEKLQNYRK